MKNIVFTPINESASSIVSPPVPAATMIPNWYKEQEALIGDKLVLSESGTPNSTVKKCMPVLDDMTAGYLILAPCDIVVSYDQENNSPAFSWSLDIDGQSNVAASDKTIPPVIASHSTAQISSVPVPSWYSKFPFKFNNYYRVSTPPGYSCLFRHPSWRFDLPFFTLSGLVDTDKHPVPVNFPFLMVDKWEGIIELGTPICQVIPFRRTEWHSSVVDGNNDDGAMQYRSATKKIFHRYKDNWREVKKWR
jgi:hypothetical protein